MHNVGSEIRKSQQEALTQIRRDSLNPYCRLHSIYEDSQFVQTVNDAYRDLPLVPNLRCGSWYTNPDIASGHEAYFKSSDGHYNNWSFNLRRPNLHLLPVIEQHNGIILVDSTRSGKRIPDALSKTVPIWCAVVNRAIRLRKLYGQGSNIQAPSTMEASVTIEHDTEDSKCGERLYTPPQSVSSQEHAQIEKRLDTWAWGLCRSTYDLPTCAKPLRPIWITPSTSSFPFVSTISGRAAAVDQTTSSVESVDREFVGEMSFYPVICLSASRVVDDGLERRVKGYSYVQGSGDDHESWSEGLTAALFWRHKQRLLNCDEDELAEVIRKIASEAKSKAGDDAKGIYTNSLRKGVPIARTGGQILMAEEIMNEERHPSTAGLDDNWHDENIALILVSASPSAIPASSYARVVRAEDNIASPERDHSTTRSPRRIHVYIPAEKKNNTQNNAFTSALASSLGFIGAQLKEGRPVCIACNADTRDSAVGIVITALQRWFDESGELRRELVEGETGFYDHQASSVTKDTIRTRLQWIIASYPAANPSRATLKRVNEYFMSERRFWESRGAGRLGYTPTPVQLHVPILDGDEY